MKLKDLILSNLPFNLVVKNYNNPLIKVSLENSNYYYVCDGNRNHIIYFNKDFFTNPSTGNFFLLRKICGKFGIPLTCLFYFNNEGKDYLYFMEHYDNKRLIFVKQPTLINP